MKKNKSWWLGIALCALASVVQAAEPVGSDAGNIEVGGDGQAIWSVPIAVPPGVQGLAPQLSVSVSQAGQLGLNGLSAITRCTGSFADFGEVRPVRYQTDDTYCLGGQPLVLIEGDAGQNGSIYHTKLENFERVEAVDQQGQGPDLFKVTTRSGGILVFGGDDLSKTTRASDDTVVS